MKRQLKQLGTLVALVALVQANAFAFESTQIDPPITARADTGGVLSASFQQDLRLAVDPEGPARPTRISWGDVIPGSGWAVAAEVIRITWEVTDPLGGVQVYTNNTVAGASPQFEDPTPLDLNNADSNPAGLLLGTAGTTGVTLPMAWSIKGNIGEDPAAANPNDTGIDGAPLDPNSFQWLFLQDSATPDIPSTNTGAFENGIDFVTMIRLAGIHFGQSDIEFGTDPDKLAYVYWQADFSTAGAQSQYQTNQLTLEAYID